ncbi:DUF3052 domain-containing protein [Cryptosporangium phraense]|uniref:DUF3052 domain-containing protein n=1 Tax=Cryptosporangium phraense TaxID=2593070 RepID=A0A545ALR1_9ACTN|nr:DUF3052 domain-containing protein [Cryptosporangium phraense]TQS42257.1 DUF3052 domain-containing protein [Cryptosporangium phraense]
MTSGYSGYSGTPLPRKLGVKSGHRVLLDGAPPSFALEPLPDDVSVDRGPADGEPYDVALVFCPDADALQARWPVVHPRTTSAGALWVAWPKGRREFGENAVREYGLTHGRVDTKVCAIDATWSGLKFVIRVADR